MHETKEGEEIRKGWSISTAKGPWRVARAYYYRRGDCKKAFLFKVYFTLGQDQPWWKLRITPRIVVYRTDPFGGTNRYWQFPPDKMLRVAVSLKRRMAELIGVDQAARDHLGAEIRSDR